jgi:hypothetical protein
VNAVQVHKGGVSDALAGQHVQLAQALKVHKVCVHHGRSAHLAACKSMVRHIGAECARKARAPGGNAALDGRPAVLPRVFGGRRQELAAHQPQRAGVARGKERQQYKAHL